MKSNPLKIGLLCFATVSAFSVHAEMSEKICRDKVKDEMINRGLMTTDVCIDFSKESSFDVKFTNYELGDNLDDKVKSNADKLKQINQLFSPYSTDVNFEGYSDGVHANFNQFDSSFFKPLPAGSKKYVQDGSTYDYVGENLKGTLDLVKVKEYIDAVKDPKAKGTLLDLYIKEKVEANPELGFKLDKENKIVYDSQLLDVLRNNALAQSRATKLCESMMGEANNCNNKDIGHPSTDLILQRDGILGKENCGERRGARVSYKFPSPVKENVEKNSFVPEFKTPSQELQADMQIASSMSLMRKINGLSDTDFPEKSPVKSNNGLDYVKSEYFWDVKKDQDRFKKVFASNKGCAENKYVLDESRRIYWSVNSNLQKMKSNLGRIDTEIGNIAESGRNEENPVYQKLRALKDSNERFINYVNKGDFGALKKEFKDVYFKSMDPATDFKSANGKYDTTSVTEKYQLYVLRSLLTGRIGDEEANDLFYSDVDQQKVKNGQCQTKDKFPSQTKDRFPIRYYEKTLLQEGVPAISKQELDKVIQIGKNCAPESTYYKNALAMSEKLTQYIDKKNQKVNLDRYPNAPYTDATKGKSIPSSAFDCLDASDAVAGYLEEYKGDDDLNSMFKIGMKAGDEVGLSYEDLNTVKVPGGQARGWLCGGCGSGVKVNPDGTMEWISRFRAAQGDEAVKKNADNTAPSANMSSNQELSLGSMKSLVVYEISCSTNNSTDKCGCLKNVKNGDELRKIISSAKKMNLAQQQQGSDKLKLAPLKADGKGCIFVPPVPHACSFNPNGASHEQDNNFKKEWGTFCKMLGKIKTDAFPLLKIPKIPGKNLEAIKKDIISKCDAVAVKVFPKSELMCAPNLNNKTGIKSSAPKSGSI
ncbi:MAG: hypothetical protein ACOYL6_12595 [Bacteriovoracaceae bacterium]